MNPTQHDEARSLRIGGDLRNLLLSNRTFILQLAHPSVGAGVVQFSNFRADPWSRMREIAYSGNQMMFHGHDAAVTEGKRLRDLHRNIKGSNAHGEQYHALNPAVYGWVHFVFYESTLTCRRLFGEGVTEEEAEFLFQDWRNSGCYFGLRDQDLPPSRQQYWDKWQTMLATTLEGNEAIDYIVHLQQQLPPTPPRLARLPRPLWQLLWQPMARYGDLITAGSLPGELRNRLQLPWTQQHQARFERQCGRIRRLFAALPPDWRLMPAARQRLAQIH